MKKPISMIFIILSILSLIVNFVLIRSILSNDDKQEILLKMQQQLIVGNIHKSQVRKTLGTPNHSGKYSEGQYDNYKPPLNEKYGYWGFAIIYNNNNIVKNIIEDRP